MRTRLSTVLVVALLSACGDNVLVRETSQAPIAAQDAPEAVKLHAAAPERDAFAPAPPAPQSPSSSQKFIRTADVRFQVDSVERAIQRIDSMARMRQAFVADVQLSNDALDASARLVIRVPATHFAGLLASLAVIGDLRNQTLTTEDVTREYADLETRLGVKEQTVARLRTLLATRTGRLDDVLSVERELARVVTELEQLKGERQYYDNRVATSTIVVSLFEPAVYARAGFWAPVATALRSSVQVLSASVSWGIYAIAFLLPWVVIATLGWFIFRRTRAARRGVAPQPQQAV